MEPDVRVYAGRKYYTRQIDVGRVIGKATRTVHEYVRTGLLRSYVLPSGRKLYAVDDVEAFMTPVLATAERELAPAGPVDR